ncbi:MAG TPA: hypothetical protein VF052_06055 [Solirubrobacterales bacterium]
MASTDPLAALAALLRDGENVISPYVRDPDEGAALGLLAGAGPRAAAAREEYVLLVEAIREGYLLHYGAPRLIRDADPDLRLLAGDYLYALGLERLAARGDLEAVRELADLISLSAQLHDENGSHPGPDSTRALWLAAIVAVGVGSSEAHELAKEALRRRDPEAADRLIESAAEAARGAGIEGALDRAAESVGFAAEDLPNRGC